MTRVDMLRSMLFIPGDSEKKLAKADDVKADALIVDLEDSVAAPRKNAARGMIREFLQARPRANRKTKLYVRINPLESDAPLRDLAAAIAGNPDGIVLPKASGPASVARVANYIDALEMREGITDAIRIVAIAGESAEGVLALSAYTTSKSERLIGLTWGPWDLAADLGAAGNRDAGGAYAFTYKMAMSLTLLAAKAAGLQAIDTPYTDFKDEKGLLAACKAIRRDGWTGKLAIHPAQVAVIHEGFRPTPEEISHAERVAQAFTTVTDGVVSLDGVMLDLPHLKQARQVLALRDAG